MAMFVGVDVGTGSVRAAAVEVKGHSLKLIKQHEEALTIYNDTAEQYEQSSSDIWLCVCKCVKALELNPSQVAGVGFDATCSLVVLNEDMKPLSVCTSGDNERNVIMWLDHRAKNEMNEVNATGHPLLKYVGGKISLEMQMPKLLWLKKNLKETFDNAGAFMDLPDFLTYKATGCQSRSMCSLVCKWAYDGPNHAWSESFLNAIGLQEFNQNRVEPIGTNVQLPGETVGAGLSPTAAAELGLLPNTPVGTSLIDAHAGGVGMLTCAPEAVKGIEVTRKIGLICGTSTCHMVVSKEASYVPGVWGPYYSAMIPDLWLSEGGQSASGKLIDFFIETHPAYAELMEQKTDNKYAYLAKRAENIAQSKGIQLQALTKDLHIWPDHHGNRSPLADPDMKGMMSGLTLSVTLDDLAILYLATLQSLIYGTKHTIEAIDSNRCDRIMAAYMCGGLTKHRLFAQMTADILDMPVIIPEVSECVLVGAAILGVCAARKVGLEEVITTVTGDGEVLLPDSRVRDYHNKKYMVFKQMMNDQLKYRQVMS